MCFPIYWIFDTSMNVMPYLVKVSSWIYWNILLRFCQRRISFIRLPSRKWTLQYLRNTFSFSLLGNQIVSLVFSKKRFVGNPVWKMIKALRENTWKTLTKILKKTQKKLENREKTSKNVSLGGYKKGTPLVRHFAVWVVGGKVGGQAHQVKG